MSRHKGLSHRFSSRTKSIAIYTGAAPENVERRCWGGARSMTGATGQLIVNMTKTGCCYYYYFIWIIKSLYRRISNVYGECGSIIALSLSVWGHARNYFYLFIFPAERAYTPVIFGYAFCRIMQSAWMKRLTTMNQLRDIRNKSAESLKTNNNNKKKYIYIYSLIM